MTTGSASPPPKGFTLLEVLAALAVLALSLLVLLQTDGLNPSRTLHANRLLGAVQLAGQMMEEVFEAGSGDLSTDSGEQETGVYAWERVVSDTQYEGLKEIRLTVRWAEGRREESYVLLAYLPR